MSTDEDEKKPLGQKLLWFVGLWIAGAGGVALAAYVIRGVFGL